MARRDSAFRSLQLTGSGQLLTILSYYEEEDSKHQQHMQQPSTNEASQPTIGQSTSILPDAVVLPPVSEQASHGMSMPFTALPEFTSMAPRLPQDQQQQKTLGVAPKDPVIGHMGRLVSDDRQQASLTTVFGGSTTGVHFISQAEQLLQMSQTHKDALPGSAYGLYLDSSWASSTLDSPSPEVSNVIQQLPDDSLIIVGKAIDMWTPLYPIIHKPTLMETTERILQTRVVADGSVNFIILYQILTLLALGSVAGHARGCLCTHPNLLCLSERFYSQSASLLDHVMNNPCLQSLQALVLVQLYLQVSGRYSRASHLSGVATRIAQTLGLHRHSQRFKFDPLETELRRRAWWCQYSLDT